MSIHAVIMAGGGGTRFWPYSTPETPKQFLDLTGEGTMLELTVKRLESFIDPDKTWVITGQRYCDISKQQAPSLPASNIIGEPMPRDTSAAIALAAGMIKAVDPDGIMMILPADHVIKDTVAFCATMKKAIELAQKGNFVTVGIPPTYPAEVYGYLKCGSSLGEDCYRLSSFVEKPCRPDAVRYLEEGGYYWNAGMFCWKVDSFLSSLAAQLPQHHQMANDLAQGYGTQEWLTKAKSSFSALEKISIDFGFMEKIDNICMVKAAFDWNDVGGWLALEDLISQDECGNTIQGTSVVRDCNNNIIITQNPHRPSIVSGIKDCIVVNAEAGTLVCHRNEIERIRDLVEKVLKK